LGRPSRALAAGVSPANGHPNTPASGRQGRPTPAEALACETAAAILRSPLMNPKSSRFFLVRLGLFLVLVLGVVLLPACANKKGGQTAGTGDYVTGTPLPERQEGTSFFSGNVQRNQFQPIYFDFDSQTIRSSENGKIQQVASFLQQNNGQIVVAGFTDERGTAEYNRGLGEQSVREALIAMGANAQNIQTVSFGAEMPADPASNEEAWAKNRRVEIGVVK
jgi:peptidoglycan-associated lipoprotein